VGVWSEVEGSGEGVGCGCRGRTSVGI